MTSQPECVLLVPGQGAASLETDQTLSGICRHHYSKWNDFGFLYFWIPCLIRGLRNWLLKNSFKGNLMGACLSLDLSIHEFVDFTQGKNILKQLDWCSKLKDERKLIKTLIFISYFFNKFSIFLSEFFHANAMLISVESTYKFRFILILFFEVGLEWFEC